MEEFDKYIEYLRDLQKRSGLTIKSYSTNITRFLEDNNINTLEDLSKLTSAICVEDQKRLVKKGLKPDSINQVKRCMKAFMNYLIDPMELLEKNPWNKVKDIPKEHDGKSQAFLSDEEVDMMLNACERVDDKTILRCYLYTGKRNSALRNLLLEDYDGEHLVFVEKRGKIERVFVIPELKKYIEEYLQYRLGRWSKDIPSVDEPGKSYSYLFVSQKGNQFSSEGIREKVKSIAKRAGIDPKRVDEIHPHTLRHTFCTSAMDVNEDMRITQALMGHANLGMTSRYSHFSNKVKDNGFSRQKVYGADKNIDNQ